MTARIGPQSGWEGGCAGDRSPSCRFFGLLDAQTIPRTARNESWVPMSNRSVGFHSRITTAEMARQFESTGRRWNRKSELEYRQISTVARITGGRQSVRSV